MITILDPPLFLTTNGILSELINNSSSTEISTLASLNVSWRNCVVYLLTVQYEGQLRASLERVQEVVSELGRIAPLSSDMMNSKPKNLVELRIRLIKGMTSASELLFQILTNKELVELGERMRLSDGMRFAKEIITCAALGKALVEKEKELSDNILDSLCSFGPGLLAHSLAWQCAIAIKRESKLPFIFLKMGFPNTALRETRLLPTLLKNEACIELAEFALEKLDYRFALEALSKVSTDDINTFASYTKMLSVIQDIAATKNDYEIVEIVAIQLSQ